MQIRHSAFAPLLAQAKPKPIYLFHGDEPILAILAIDALRARLFSQGFQEREVWQVERGFQWNEALANVNAGSLFASQKFVEVRLSSNKFGAGEGEAHFLSALKSANQDTVMVVAMPKLDKGQFMSAWFKLADEQGIVVDCAPIEREALGQWIKQGITAHGQTVSNDAILYLVEASEGNLLASKQAIDALAVSGWHDLTLEVCEEVVSFAARFATAQLSEAFLAADSARAVTILRGLRAEQEAIPRVVSQLSVDVHLIARVLTLMRAQGQGPAQAIKNSFVWGKRQAALMSGLPLMGKQVATWLSLLPELDAAAKGLRPKLEVWDALERFVLLQK